MGARETALQGGLVMAKNGRLELGDNIYQRRAIWAIWKARSGLSNSDN